MQSLIKLPRPRSTYRKVFFLALVIAVIFGPFISLGFGAAAVPLSEAIQITWLKLTHQDLSGWEPTTVAIIWNNRLPRIIAAYGVGIVLGISGVAMQAIIRNPLAEPYVLGISSGASAGAATAIIILGTSAAVVVTSSAFVGALIATLLVIWIGAGRTGSSLRLILAGIAIGFIFQAITNLLIISANTAESAQSVVFWTLGSLTRADSAQALFVLGIAIVLTLGLWLLSPYLDALASGDQACIAVGLNPMLLRLLLLVPISLGVGVAVATSGGIGFIGLVIPHLMRPLVSFKHRPLIICTALLSALFLLFTDTLARTVLSPVEIPIGIITALIGAPFLILLTKRSKAMS
ncbi:Membrane permease protein [Corynebacterium kutscheri]|uniref:ABC-type Fe3+-siderophore transport system, permease component n=1 Tax=Corynebacterium kutscheri TaxID=35755 RepID=A0A0F6R0D5_9CORY|nr:iron ABC transporter permease [Corynebacterium kutscheri]AKE41677.1 ABC-type Fe3+-siderophore transport system, permease component [Corynebacterium kutscheri]VEH08953.1 Membrane permease protein [Corynebacterium kutscheri]VEH10004.1 Membrane permease protein [Corynebacterium kutscheri]VEH80085.1 Membrane permease protein [Corynebacterium kutscheri]